MEAKKENKIEIIEESNETDQIEETINAMISKVMEEKDKTNSLDFDDDEIEDDSFKISRDSTRHQTTANQLYFLIQIILCNLLICLFLIGIIKEIILLILTKYPTLLLIIHFSM